MRKKLLFILIIIILATLSLSACGKKLSSIDLASRGFTLTVTYDCLGGKIQDQNVRVIYTQEDSYLLEPSGSTNLVEPIKLGYVLEGWYTSYTIINLELGDIDGNRLFGEENKWNFVTDKLGSESIILYAYWSNQKTVTWKYNNGQSDIVWKVNPYVLIPRPSIEPTKTGYTFVDFYKDEALTEKWDFAKDTLAGDVVNANIYARWLSGTYIRINKVSGLMDKTTGKSKITSTGKYILGQDLDLEGANFVPSCVTIRSSFTGEFLGNGYSISNYTIDVNSNAPTGASYGFIGFIDHAVITDLTINNCIMIINSESLKPANIGIIAGTSTNNSVISNCSVNGAIYNEEVSNSTGLINAGGILGKGVVLISNCYSEVNININNSEGNFSGGIIGSGELSSTINNSISNSTVSIGEGTAGSIAGSFLGTITRSVLIDDQDDDAVFYDGINSSNEQLLIFTANDLLENYEIITAWLNGATFTSEDEFIIGSETNTVDVNGDLEADYIMWLNVEDEFPVLWYTN